MSSNKRNLLATQTTPLRKSSNKKSNVGVEPTITTMQPTVEPTVRLSSEITVGPNNSRNSKPHTLPASSTSDSRVISRPQRIRALGINSLVHEAVTHYESTMHEVEEDVDLDKEVLDIQAKLVSLEEAQAIAEFEEAKANADFFWKSIYFLTDLIGPTISIFCVMLLDTIQWCLAAVFRGETSMEFFQNKARYHIGWFLGEFRKFLPPWMNHLIDSTDSSDLRSKRNIGFICISLFLYVVFKFVQSFVTCKGTVNDVVESWAHNNSLKNVTQFARHENVSMQKTELCWDACMWLSVITIVICTFHNNTTLYGYAALAFWGVWALAYIVHELLLVFVHDEVDCPLFFNVNASNATQAVMLKQPYEIVLRMD